MTDDERRRALLADDERFRARILVDLADLAPQISAEDFLTCRDAVLAMRWDR